MEVMELQELTASHGKALKDLLARRRSPYAFSPRPVEPERLRALLEAARSAPSSYNEQPWRFIVATRDDPEAFERLLSVLVDGNRQWAKNAPVLTISVAKLDFSNGSPNRHAFHDVGQAAAYLTVQATALGLAVHQMGGFDAQRTRELLRIPEGYEPVAAIALGYPGDPEDLPEPLRSRQNGPRSRKPLEELVFAGDWDQPFPLRGDAKPARDPSALKYDGRPLDAVRRSKNN
jgi:nitroreductase